MFPINLSGFKPSVDSVSIIGFYLKKIEYFILKLPLYDFLIFSLDQ